jgi:tRNA threonylcarbamoyladenosine biosynthesis protein TsaE
VTIESHSEAETERFGERLGAAATPGLVIGLRGPLGAGKTALVRGLARGLGIDPRDVRSPTFITATEYRGRLPIAHLDLYRHDETLPPSDWLAEVLEGSGVAAVEWIERLGSDLPEDLLQVEIAYGERAEDRRLEVRAVGERAAAVLARVSAAATVSVA